MKTENFLDLKKVISRFKNTSVLVIGDVMLDEYVWGKVSRISPEAPVPVVWVRKESFMPGGASNVASNLASLGGKALLAGVLGADEEGAILRSELKKKGIDTAGLVTDDTRPTILKTRVIAHHQQVVRIDKEKQVPISSKTTSTLLDYIKKKINSVDALIIEDYGKGVITPRLLSEIARLAKAKKKIITVDPKEEHFSFYKGITAITPNEQEAAYGAGVQIKNEGDLRRACSALVKKLDCEVVLVTLGERGMCLFEKGKKAVRIPTIAQDVFDVSGAGDTVVSAFTLSLACGAKPTEAAHIANCAAGIVVGKLGTAVVGKTELLKRIKEEIER